MPDESRPAGQQVVVTRALGSRYLLGRELGSGAMGRVHQALDSRTGEQVAAKVLRPDLARDPQLVTRFVQERTVLLDLVHPHVVRVRDLVIEGDDLAIVMDLVSGGDLRALLTRSGGTVAPATAVRLASQVLEALAAAHARGVLHRDVKPDNVLLLPGAQVHALLSDFGIARLTEQTTVKATGALGTLEYMAPEVFTTEQVSGATDVYAVGCTLYELLAGRTPFGSGAGGFAVVNRHVTAEPPVVPGLPAPVTDLLLAMLAKDPARRLSAASASAALADLLPALEGLPALPVQPTPQSWGEAPGVLPREEGTQLRGRPAVGTGPVDPGATQLRGLPDPGAAPGPLPAAGPSAPGWIGPVPGAGFEDLPADGGTVLSAPRARRTAVAEPEVPEADTRKRTVLITSVVGGLLVVAVGLVLLLHGGGSGHKTAARTGSTVAASVQDQVETDPSGLVVARSAAWDPKAGTVATTLTWSSTGPTLSGPLLESVPAATAGQPCPAVAWTGVTAVRSPVTGVDDSACAWELTVPPITKEPGSGTYTVVLPIKGDEASLTTYLGLAQQSRSAALSGLTGSAAYPVQRLESLDVQVTGTVRQGSPVQLSVAPQWVGAGGPDLVHTLYDTRSPGVSPLLTALGGKLHVSTDTCSSSIAVTGNAPYANAVGTGCTLSVQLGPLTADSEPFDVVTTSG